MQAKFCSKCGTPIDEGHKFCRKCGTPVKSMAAPSQQMPAAGRPAPDIPSYQEIEARLNSAGAGRNEPSDYNPEGTVLLGGPGSVSSAPSAYGNVKRKAEIRRDRNQIRARYSRRSVAGRQNRSQEHRHHRS